MKNPSHGQHGPVEGTGNVTNPWLVQERAFRGRRRKRRNFFAAPAGGRTTHRHSALPTVPLSRPGSPFFVAGHDGLSEPAGAEENVCDCRARRTRAKFWRRRILHATISPRRSVWDLNAHAGRKAPWNLWMATTGRLRGLAVGPIRPGGGEMPAVDPRSLAKDGRTWASGQVLQTDST